MNSKFTTKDVKIIHEENAYQGFFQIKKITLQHRLFSGKWSEKITREVFSRGHSVGVLLYDPKLDQVVLTQQFRIGAIEDKKSPWLLEIVAGMIEENENTKDVAIRETKEEANCIIQHLIPICHYYSSPGGTSETLQLFCGIIDSSQLNKQYESGLEEEDIRVYVLDQKETYHMIQKGEIKNAAAIIALQWLEINKKNIAH